MHAAHDRIDGEQRRVSFLGDAHLPLAAIDPLERVAIARAVDRVARGTWHGDGRLGQLRLELGAVELLRENGVFALCFGEEHGGTGTGTLTFLRAVEELSYADATVGLVLAVQSLGAAAIQLAGSEEQRERYLPRWASGEWISSSR